MMRAHPVKYLAALCMAAAVQACSLVNPPEDIPAYIHSRSYTVVTDSVTQGTNSDKITDMWLSVGNDFIGAFELPATAPVLKKGTQRVIMQAGVKTSGLSTVRAPYPFFEAYIDTVDLAETRIDTIKPVYRYRKNTRFRLLEDFEDASFSFEPSTSNTADIRYIYTPDSAFGGRSLKATLNAQHNKLVLVSKEVFVMPQGKAVWMELNYRNDIPLELGVFASATGSGSAQQVAIVGMRATDKFGWNKIYVSLGTTIGDLGLANNMKLYFLAPLPDGVTQGHILLDNIKLLYLE